MNPMPDFPGTLLTACAKPLFIHRQNHNNGYLGCFESKAAAQQFIGPRVKAQFAGNTFVDPYKQLMRMFRSEDYPVLYWLSRLVTAGTKIFDLGGGIGQSFFSYDPYLSFPKDLSWRVCDVPALSREGTLLAEKKQEPRLTFSTSFQDGDGHEILLTNGTLQYLEQELADIISAYRHRPRHILINRIPVTDKAGFWTMQRNHEGLISPYHIFGRDSLVGSLEQQGYKLRDNWQHQRTLTIPFYPQLSLERYSGYYFLQA